jgi:hypothetical protein
MLEQKQLYLASRLFVAAGKAGLPFDLARFSNDRAYSNQTLSELALSLTDAEAQTLIVELTIAMQADLAVTHSIQQAAVLPQESTLTEFAQQKSEPAPEKKYVGRLR